jgi:hypothetical protein
MAEAWAAARRSMTAAVLRVNVSFMVQGMFECRDLVLCQWGVGSREWGVGRHVVAAPFIPSASYY